MPYDAKVYDEWQADFAALEIRMESAQNPNTELLVKFFENIDTQITATRKTHQDQGTLSAPSCHITRVALNEQLASLMTYQMSLPGAPASGADSSTAKTESTATASARKAAQRANKE